MSDKPQEIRLRQQGQLLELRLESGEKYALAAEYLRVESPSAEVKGHGPEQAVTVGGKKNVTITNLEPIGNYALRIIFSDGHSTGLYTWSYLAELKRDETRRWNSYLDRLKSEGLSR